MNTIEDCSHQQSNKDPITRVCIQCCDLMIEPFLQQCFYFKKEGDQLYLYYVQLFLIQLNAFKEALEIYEEGLKTNEQIIDVLNRRGDALLFAYGFVKIRNLGRPEEAQESYKGASKYEKFNTQFYHQKSVAL